jgi:hypothetical protein
VTQQGDYYWAVRSLHAVRELHVPHYCLIDSRGSSSVDMHVLQRMRWTCTSAGSGRGYVSRTMSRANCRNIHTCVHHVCQHQRAGYYTYVLSCRPSYWMAAGAVGGMEMSDMHV